MFINFNNNLLKKMNQNQNINNFNIEQMNPFNYSQN